MPIQFQDHNPHDDLEHAIPPYSSFIPMHAFRFIDRLAQPSGLIFSNHVAHRSWSALAVTLALTAGAAGQAMAQTLVYDNTTHVRTNLVYKFSREYGDEVFLEAGYRTVSEFAFQYFGDFNPTNRVGASAVVRFYENDGVDGIPGPKTALMPKTVLWESPSIPLLPGYNLVTLGVPLVDVPDSFTWTVKFSGVTGANQDAAGLVLADPPTVGQPLPDGRFGSYWDAWIRDDPNREDGWSLINFGFRPNDPKANFYAQIRAVPEPQTWGLLVAGGVLLALGCHRRR